jgi:hypothetical protein
MSRKSFEVARAEVKGEPLEFDLGGDPYAVELPLPGMALLDMADVASAEGSEAVGAFGNFLRAALGPKEFERFHAESLEKRLSIEQLLEVVQYVLEEATGRPTVQPSASLKSVSTGTSGSPVAAKSAG